VRIISPTELPTLKGIHFCNPYRLELEAQGKFPRRIRLGARRYGYAEHEVDAWLEQRAALRDTARANTASRAEAV
jgi:predicted DNA-binding transcriptional regulator AlpA